MHKKCLLIRWVNFRFSKRRFDFFCLFPKDILRKYICFLWPLVICSDSYQPNTKNNQSGALVWLKLHSLPPAVKLFTSSVLWIQLVCWDFFPSPLNSWCSDILEKYILILPLRYKNVLRTHWVNLACRMLCLFKHIQVLEATYATLDKSNDHMWQIWIWEQTQWIYSVLLTEHAENLMDIWSYLSMLGFPRTLRVPQGSTIVLWSPSQGKIKASVCWILFLNSLIKPLSLKKKSIF